MLIKTHLVFGIFLYFVLFNYINNIYLFLLALIIGIIIVDLDTKKSKYGKFILFRPIQLFLNHRGITHSIFFGFILFALLTLIHSDIAIGFFVGFLSHVFLDCLTPSGVAILWPFTNYKVRFIIKTGSITEQVIFVLLLLLDIFLFFRIIF